MTIGKKLYVGFGAILAILVLLFIVNITAVMREHSARAEADAAEDGVRTIEAIRFQMMQNRLYLGNYLLNGDMREEQKVDRGVADLAELIRQAEGKAGLDALRTALSQVGSAERDWSENFAKPLTAKRRRVDAGDSTVAELQVYYLQLNPSSWLAKSSGPLDEANVAIRKFLQISEKSSLRATRTSMAILTIGTLLAIVLGMGVAFHTSRSITRPLDHLIAVVREIGESGDLNQKVNIEREDEIGVLARTFENMVKYLREMAAVSAAVAEGDLTVEVQPRSKRDTLAHAFARMAHGLRVLVRQVRDSASQVASGSNQVASASEETARVSVQASSAIDEVTSTMHEMSINVQNVVKNTQVQASSVAETSTSIDQMVASIQRVADTAKVLLDISHRSREEVQAGIATMEKTADGLNRTNTSIQASSQIIGVLGHRAEDIGRIIEVIDDLAEQTNLLALNAAIEAARAGEHGLGFAVVADEVRKLAEKSTQSTKEIADLIASIQKEARDAVENMEKSTSMVQEGLQLGNDLNAALHKIANVVTEVYKFAQEIGAATQEQSNGSAQIAKATTQLNEITQEITSSVEEQASGAQGVVRSMEKMRGMVQQTTSSSTELAAAAEQMSKLSQMLLETMGRFVLESASGGRHAPARPPSRGFESERTTSAQYTEVLRS